MRKLLLILLLLLLPLNVFALCPAIQSVVAIGEEAGASCADSSCTGFLACQNFEGTGYDNSESWTESCGTGATCDEDSTASPLRGTQSYQFTTGTGDSYAYKSITASDEIYFFARIKVANDASGLLIKIQNGSTSVFTIGYNAGNNKFIYNAATLGHECLTGTVYYVWGYYKKGTGSDEINRAWVSTTLTKPASVDYEITDGTSTAQADRFYIYDTAAGTGAGFDQVLVKTTSIGDVCE